MITIGIDPGQKGGIVAITDNRKVIVSEVMPTIGGKEIDAPGLREILYSLKCQATEQNVPITAFLEKVRARPGQGVVSMFTFGRGLGIVEGVIAGLQIPSQQVIPGTWVKEMHEGLDLRLNPKARSLLVVRRLYPNLNLLATTKSKNMHDGLIDAALIATYGMRKLKGGVGESKYYKNSKRSF